MGYHEWGDEDFDWNSLNQAIRIGTKLMKTLGRIGVHSKEKYGSARWSLYLCDGTLHSFTHPGYVYSQYPKWLWVFDINYRPLRFVAPIINFWQKLVVRFTFNYLCYKFPHIVEEIVSDAPRELLSPKLKKIAGSLWSTHCTECDTWYTCDNEVCPNCGKKQDE